MSQSDAVPRLTHILSGLGWTVGQASPEAPLPTGAELIICDTKDVRLVADGLGDSLLAVIGEACAQADIVLSGREAKDDLAALLRLPGHDQLNSMARTFGRAPLTPLLEGLRTELRAALAILMAGGMPDSHKLAGLAGTLGFTDASTAWRNLDEGVSSTAQTRRATRIAILSINHWLTS